MPIYEYVCLNCNHQFEVIRPMSQADAPQSCQKCGAEEIKRKISRFFAESGGSSVARMNEPACGSCSSGNCGSCGH